MPRATAILREKVIDEGRVPATPGVPVGVRCRLAFVRSEEATPAVLYGNHAPKGPHRHVEGREEVYTFVTPSSS